MSCKFYIIKIICWDKGHPVIFISVCNHVPTNAGNLHGTLALLTLDTAPLNNSVVRHLNFKILHPIVPTFLSPFILPWMISGNSRHSSFFITWPNYSSWVLWFLCLYSFALVNHDCLFSQSKKFLAFWEKSCQMFFIVPC